jgi:hypothetical protein
VEEKEKFDDAIVRELGEEIGLVPELKIIPWKKYSWRRYQKPDTEFHIYHLSLGNCLTVEESKHGQSLTTSSDRYDQKVGCFVHGEENNIKSFLNAYKIYFYANNDKIIGICAVNVGELRIELLK